MKRQTRFAAIVPAIAAGTAQMCIATAHASDAPAAGDAPEPAARTLSLKDAIDIVLRIDPLVAEAKVADERAKLAELRAQLDRVSVKVDGQLQELWNRSNWGGQGGVVEGGQGLFNLAANINAPLFAGFRIQSNVARTQKLEVASRAQIRQNIKDTSLAVARAYWSVRRIELLLETQAHALGRLEEAEAVAAARVSAGLAPPIDRNRASLRRLQQVSTLVDLRGQLAEALAQLGASLGVAGKIALTDAPRVERAALPSVATLLSEALANRPEIAQASAQTAAQHFAVKMAQSNYYPQLSLFGLLQYGNNPYIPGVGSRGASDASNPFTNLAANITLGAQLSMNFFDTLNTYTTTKDAKYEERRLGEEERRMQRQVDTDVRTAHAKVQKLYDQLGPLKEARDLASDNVKIIEGRYRNGDALVIEFLDSEVELNNAEVQISDVTAQIQVAVFELDAALGREIGARHE